jgi:hypothetical protein
MRVFCATTVLPAAPMDLYPTATQKWAVGHEVPNRPDHDPTVGLGRIVQALPPKTSTNVLIIFE